MNKIKDIKNIKYITYLDMKNIKQILHDMYWKEENENQGKYIFEKCKEILTILNNYNIYGGK